MVHTSMFGSLTGHRVSSASRKRFIRKHDMANKYRDSGSFFPSEYSRNKFINHPHYFHTKIKEKVVKKCKISTQDGQYIPNCFYSQILRAVHGSEHHELQSGNDVTRWADYFTFQNMVCSIWLVVVEVTRC